MHAKQEISNANFVRLQSFRAALTGALPFFMFGSAYALEAIHELGYFSNFPGVFFHYLIVLVYLLVTVGAGIGWILYFPQWSYA